VASLQKALQMAPDSPLVNNNLGVAFQLAENPQKAKEKLQAAAKLSPAYDAPLYNLGMIAFLAGDKAEAARQWQAYLVIDPSSAFAGRIAANLATRQAPQPAAKKPEAVPEKVSGLGVGDYTDAVPAEWGAPVKKKSFLGEENPVILAVYANGVTVVAREDEIVRLSVSGPFGGQTVTGISLGADGKKLTNLYGKPPTVLPSTAGDTWVYPAQGVAFVVRDGKVVSWILFKSQ
jgi:tetratricopeptide (TPR) repeat protein